MGIREWVLRPWFWWKERKRRKVNEVNESITARVMQETGCDIHDIGGGGLDAEKVAAFKKRSREMDIARKNRERKESTLGYGLKSRNFRPRPSFEKKLYDLTKKPGDEDD